ncbi:DNA mismatch repair protein MutS [Saprospira grandis DSM 2844]|uniref:DNA mismatch repair protein MutS n=1 Tax=Saprospira grandis DSM 2844 TaxID=694433 RepID=J0P074_9BACT|nr:DNA mismatch repair protein MutS [Saprospira grandis]EJF53164.1 DNA mismatch repair protein MutS [Saprospira grandis DSM 2844]
MKLAKSKKKTKVTPLMAQYNDFKQKYADAVLLFRVGDFYETFGSDAVLASKVLGITLTARNNGSSKIELAGFPHHSLDTYLPKLVRAGYRVAVCDQLEKPSKQKKIVKRGVVELVTPGITTNDNILDHKSNNFLAALHIGRKDQLGLALLDISTAEFLVVEGNTASIDKLLQNFQPAEIIYAKNQKKELLDRFGERYYTYGIEDWVFMPDYSREKLLEQFEVSSLKGFGIEQLEMAQIAAGAILHYVQTTENKNLKHIVQIARIPTDRYVWMDSFTIRNLELVGSAYSSGVSLLDVMDKTISPMGSRLLRKWVLMPRKDLTSIVSRHEVVQAFIEQPNLALLIAEQLQQLGDLERLVAKIPLGKINPREVRQLQRSILALGPIKEALAQDQQPQLQSIAERMQLCPLLCQRVDNWLKEEPAVKTDKGGFIANGVSEELDELRDLIANSREHLERIRVQEAKETGIDKLKIGFNNVFGYYLEVTNRYKDKDLIPDHWVRKQTLTNSERYISEELKQLEGKILSAEEKIIALEQKLFGELVLFLNDYIRPVQTNAQLVAQLDCLHSYHVLALEQNYCRPQMHEGLEIEIKAGRHPVIEQQLKAGELYVPNDIFLDNERQQVLMITGPNMSGKSALLRQTALISLMAQMGAFVPADSAKLGLIDRIFTRVGASDNISSGESTFMVEMNETASILNNISNRSLILLDEIGRGTSTYDGISIAWAIAEYLHNHPTARPKTLFATHYHELNELAQQFDRIKNFHVATKELGKKVIFLRKLKAGGSEHSFGIHVAKMAGMPPQLILRASEILAQLEEQRSAQEEKAESLGDKLKAVQNVQAMQLNIFDAAPDPRFEKMRDYVEALDLNRMTPIESMLKLLEIKKILGEEDH